MIKKYALESEIVKAVQYTGDNIKEIIDLTEGGLAFKKGEITLITDCPCKFFPISVGDYVVRKDEHSDSFVVSEKKFKSEYTEVK